jgi:hypothetical protein
MTCCEDTLENVLFCMGQTVTAAEAGRRLKHLINTTMEQPLFSFYERLDVARTLIKLQEERLGDFYREIFLPCSDPLTREAGRDFRQYLIKVNNALFFILTTPSREQAQIAINDILNFVAE